MTRLLQKIKKLVLPLLVIITALVPCAICHADATQADQLSIAMILWRGETAAEKSFISELHKLGYTPRYSIFDAAQDKTAIDSIIKNNILAHPEEYDYVYTFGTTVSQETKKALNNRIPQIFNIVVDPVGAGLVATVNGSQANIAGVSNQVPLAMQLENVGKIINFQSLGFLYNPLENNSILIRDRLRELAGTMNFQLVEQQASPQDNQLDTALQSLISLKTRPDLVYLPADSFLISQAEKIATELNKNKIKSIGAVRSYIEKGILLGTVADYPNLGAMAAAIIDRHQKGESLGEIPVQIQAKPRLVLNASTAKHLQVELPDNLLEISEIIK